MAKYRVKILRETTGNETATVWVEADSIEAAENIAGGMVRWVNNGETVSVIPIATLVTT